MPKLEQGKGFSMRERGKDEKGRRGRGARERLKKWGFMQNEEYYE